MHFLTNNIEVWLGFGSIAIFIFSLLPTTSLVLCAASVTNHLNIIIIIIIIERKDLGGIVSKDCKDTLQMLKTVTKRECDAK